MKKGLEDEVGMRLEFENKINKLNHYNRQLQQEIKDAKSLKEEIEHRYELVSRETKKYETAYLSEKEKADRIALSLKQEQLLKTQFKDQFDHLNESHKALFDEVKLLKKEVQNKVTKL
jgi:chromosome segregation ATPase